MPSPNRFDIATNSSMSRYAYLLSVGQIVRELLQWHVLSDSSASAELI